MMTDPSGTPRDRAIAELHALAFEHPYLGDRADALLAVATAGQAEPLHEVQCPSCSATIRARMADASPSGGEPAAAIEPGTPDDPRRALCPHCEDGHRDPRTVPWGVRLGSELDFDDQPTHLRVERTQGSHVAQSDADWLWNLIRTYRAASVVSDGA